MSTLYERREYVGNDGVSRFYMMVDYVPFAFVTWHIKGFLLCRATRAGPVLVMHIHKSVSAIGLTGSELNPPRRLRLRLGFILRCFGFLCMICTVYFGLTLINARCSNLVFVFNIRSGNVNSFKSCLVGHMQQKPYLRGTPYLLQM